MSIKIQVTHCRDINIKNTTCVPSVNQSTWQYINSFQKTCYKRARSLFYSSLQLELHKNLTFLKFHAQRKSLYQLIKLQPRKLVGSKNDTIRTYRLPQHGCNEHSCIVPLPTQMDDAESSPGGGCVTSARKMIIGTSDTKGTPLRTKARSRIMLRPPTCLRKKINTFPQERTETKTLHKECRY